MPYTIEKRGEEFCVINKKTGKNNGCSNSRERAIAHMRLLYGVDEKPAPRKK